MVGCFDLYIYIYIYTQMKPSISVNSEVWRGLVLWSFFSFDRYDFVTGTKTYIRRVEYEDRGLRYMGNWDKPSFNTRPCPQG